MTENEKVTAPVTAPDPNADGLDIIPELRRNEDNSLKHPWKTTSSQTSSETSCATPAQCSAEAQSATAHAADASGGAQIGETSSTSPPSSASIPSSDEFAKFRVDPAEIETKINREADRRWRAWVPTKEDRTRHRKSWYVKQVRKEFYK